MVMPVLKPNSSWFTPTVDTVTRSSITTINITNKYTPGEVTDSWDASVAQDGGIMCYVEGDKLTIVVYGGFDRLYMSPDASWTFSDINQIDYFSNLTQITGANMMDLSGSTSVEGFFSGCALLQDVEVSYFNLKSCINTDYMFYNCSSLEVIDVSTWNVSSVQTMRYMFQSCSAIKLLNVSNWNTSSCTDLSYMFCGCGELTDLDVSNFDVSEVTEFNHIFCNCPKLEIINIAKWNVSKAISFNAMFSGCVGLKSIDVTGFNLSNMISLSQMFEGCEGLEDIIGLDTWTTPKVKNFGEMFRYCSHLKSLDLSGFDTRNATSSYEHADSVAGMSNMFEGMSSLEKITLGSNFTFVGTGDCTDGYLPIPSASYISDANGLWYSENGDSYDSINVPSLSACTYCAYPFAMLINGMNFRNSIPDTATSIVFTKDVAPEGVATTDLSATGNNSVVSWLVDTTYYVSTQGNSRLCVNKNASNMFKQKTALTSIDFSNFYTNDVVNMSYMFYGCTGLTTLDVSSFNTSKVTNMSYMFGTTKGGAMGLTSINFGANFVKSSVTDISYMFYYCSNLIALEIDDWDISNVFNMSNFCRNCTNLTTFGANNLKDWDLGNVIYLDEAFRGLVVMPKLEIEGWNVSKVKTMYCLFCQNEKMFVNLDLRNWDVSNVEDLGFVFWGCLSMVTLNCENWNVKNVVTFDHFIARCSKITDFNHSGWKVTSKCENLNALFHSYKGKFIDVRGWDTSNVKVWCQTFEACSNCTEIYGLGELSTASGEDFTQTFASTRNVKVLDLSNFDTRKARAGVLLGSNDTYGDGMSGMLPSTVTGTTTIILGKNFTFKGDGTLTSGQEAVMPVPSSKTWYTIDGTAYTAADIKAMENPAGAYYSTTALVDKAIEAINSKKYISVNTLRTYHGKLSADIDEKLDTIQTTIDNIGEIEIEDIKALFNVGV